MNNEQIFWEDVIRAFFSRKKGNEAEKYLHGVIKEIGDSYKKENYFGQREIEDFFNQKINKKDKDQGRLDFLEDQISQVESWLKKPDSLDLDLVRVSYNEKKVEIASKFNPNSWITWAASRAKNVSFATHVAKLTHSAIDSASFYDQVVDRMDGRLTTSSLKNPDVDGAVRGNQYSPIFQFLELELAGEKLAKQFANSHCTVLQEFGTSNEDISKWNAGFRDALRSDSISAHALLKQIYFPVFKTNEGRQYHLLCNLVSSSMAHRIFSIIKLDQKKTITIKEKKKYSENRVVYFPNTASLAVTASNHGNASQLNGKRGGNVKLFPCYPPFWQSRLKHPAYKKSFFFESSIYFQAKEDIDYLRDFLLRFQNLDISVKDPKRKKWVERWVGNIIDEVFFYVASIQELDSGWSANTDIKLVDEHRYLLDPYRDDSEFQAARAATEWQPVICADFARWLNLKLAGKDKQFTPQAVHTRLWRKLFEPELRVFNEELELNKKHGLEVRI